MTDRADDAVVVGREAWARIKENSRRSWDDWLKVGKAVALGRAESMQKARCNRPIGTSYVRVFGAWLRDNGFSETTNQERYAILKILEHLDAVTAWRDGLDEARRRRHNHPSLWHVFRRATKAETGTPTRQPVQGAKSKAAHRPGKPVYFGQDIIRRAAMALRECRSGDIFTAARATLEAAIRSENDLLALLNEAKPPQAKAPATPSAELAAHV
jgi:hypothetical protein